MAAATYDDIMNLIKEMKTTFENRLAQFRISANQVKAAVLSDLSKNLGLIRAGEFRSGNNVEPGQGFSGVRIGYPPFSYENRTWNIAGVNEDKLQFGLDSDSGEAFTAGGNIVLNSEGIISYSDVAHELRDISGASYYFTFLGNAYVQKTGFTGDIMGIHHANVYPYEGDSATETITNGDFEDGLENWTVTGNVTVVDDVVYHGNKAIKSIRTATSYASIQQTFDTIAGYDYLVKVRHRADVANSQVYLVFTNTDSGQTWLNTPLANTWTTSILFLRATSSTMTIWLTGNSTNNAVYIDYIEVFACAATTHAGFDKSTVKQFKIFHNPENSNIGGTRLMNVQFQETPTSVTEPFLESGGSSTMLYMKNDKLIIKFHDAGTWRYKYLDLTGTGVTWVHTTSAP